VFVYIVVLGLWRRCFTINWIQFATTWGALALFLVALISL